MSFKLVINSRRLLRESEKISGVSVDVDAFKDTSWETILSLADACIHLSYEISKVSSTGLQGEVRRLTSLQNSMTEIGESLLTYRERIAEKAPELVLGEKS